MVWLFHLQIDNIADSLCSEIQPEEWKTVYEKIQARKRAINHDDGDDDSDDNKVCNNHFYKNSLYLN